MLKIPRLLTPQQLVIDQMKWHLRGIHLKNKKYSMRALARDLKCSPSFLTMFFKGKKKLSLKKAKQIAELTHMPEREKDRFLKYVILASIPEKFGDFDEIQTILYGRKKRTAETTTITDQLFSQINSWDYFAVLMSTRCHDFDGTAEWISKKLGFNIHLVNKIVKKLENLHFLKIKNSKIIPPQTHFKMPSDMNLKSVRDFKKTIIEKGVNVIFDETDSKNLNKIDCTNITMCINPEKISSVIELIEVLKYQISDHLTFGHCSEIYQMNLQLFPLSR